MKIITLIAIREEAYYNFIKHDRGSIKYYGIIGQLVMNSPVPMYFGIRSGKNRNK
jgi:hypothetical protein